MINNEIFFTLYNLTHQCAFFDAIAIFFAKYFPYLVIILAGLFLLLHHEIFSAEHPFKELAQKWKEIVLVFFSGIFAWVISDLSKVFFHVERPFLQFPDVVPLLEKTGFSFPSGHATFYMALAFAIFFSHKKAGYIFILFAFLIGIARIVVGVHFPFDILGGFILGAGIAYIVRIIYDGIQKKPNNLETVK
ncbi:MAG TPA: phosphatase PAP2 family protein [Candidatus Paceibacterota bacterium]|nr:phosphatase PAP2 family protein [Candidatus Paceibacterota bacterium]HPT18384.1 phosphatase PAP2 family protein [Candidatus Paceibacterota bacterium]